MYIKHDTLAIDSIQFKRVRLPTPIPLLTKIYTMNIKIKKLSEQAVIPVRAHNTDAGYDLTATRITTELNECGQLVIVYHTDLAVEIPEGYAGFLFPRSSVSKKSLRLSNCVGVIDAGYRGEIMAKFNSTTDVVPAVYKEGEKIAQLVIIKVESITFEEAELEDTERGEGGFGSTDNISAGNVSIESFEDKEASTNSEETTDQAAGVEGIPEQV